MEWRYTGKNTESPETRKLKAEADLKDSKAAQERIKLGVTQNEYNPASVIQAELVRLLGNMEKSLLAIGHNVASDLTGLDAETIQVTFNVMNCLQ